MKKILLLLFSLFFLSSPSVFADDISDFQIEGMSIGDSLLDFMTEEEILEGVEFTKDWYSFLDNPYKYSQINLPNTFSKYDFVSVFIKNNATNEYISDKNEEFKILGSIGIIAYVEDFDECKKEQNKVSDIFYRMFSNTQKTETSYSHRSDPSGKSIKDDVIYSFDSGEYIVVSCENFEETFRLKKKWTEGLKISINSKEIVSWFIDTKR